MQRSKQLSDIRPSILTILPTQTTSQEQFQNTVLRPILKFQHELLMALFKRYAHKRKDVFFNLSPSKKRTYIQQAIQRDNAFRNKLIGCIIGQFTLEEHEIFIKEEQELTKRMMGMCTKRLEDYFCG